MADLKEFDNEPQSCAEWKLSRSHFGHYCPHWDFAWIDGRMTEFNVCTCDVDNEIPEAYWWRLNNGTD